MRTCFDVETSTFNKGHPFDPRNILVSYAVKSGGNRTSFHYYNDPGFIAGLADCAVHATELVLFNGKFDLHWCTRVGVRFPDECRIWDCSLAEFVISGQTNRFATLNDSLTSYGESRKPDLVSGYWAQGISTELIPVPILEEYNVYDVDGTSALQHYQQELMSDEQIALVYLMGEDLKALQHAEYSGIKFDQARAEARLNTLGREVKEAEEVLHQFLPDVFNDVHDGLGRTLQFNWDSGDQLSALLYGATITYEFPVPEESLYKSGKHVGEAYTRNRIKRTEVLFERRFVPIDGTEVAKTRNNEPDSNHLFQTDAPTIKQLVSREKANMRLIQALQARSEKQKVIEMIESIKNKMLEMHWEDNTIHGQFNQNVVITGRLSSSGPNMQNTPLDVDELLVSRYD